jgi:transcriptional regulator of acetoin/glycerol metabolism
MPRPLDRLIDAEAQLARRAERLSGDRRLRAEIAGRALRRVLFEARRDARLELLLGDLHDALDALAEIGRIGAPRGVGRKYSDAEIADALAAAGGRIREAARASGIPRSTLSRRAAECPAQNWQLARDTSGKPLQR